MSHVHGFSNMGPGTLADSRDTVERRGEGLTTQSEPNDRYRRCPVLQQRRKAEEGRNVLCLALIWDQILINYNNSFNKKVPSLAPWLGTLFLLNRIQFNTFCIKTRANFMKKRCNDRVSSAELRSSVNNWWLQCSKTGTHWSNGQRFGEDMTPCVPVEWPGILLNHFIFM